MMIADFEAFYSIEKLKRLIVFFLKELRNSSTLDFMTVDG